MLTKPPVSQLLVVLQALILTGLLLSGFAATASAQQAEAIRTAPPKEDTTSLVFTAGAVGQAGNTQTLAVNAGSSFQLIRGAHWFEANLNWVYSQDFKPDPDQLVAHNINGLARYDLFFTKLDGMWALSKLRWDRFAALNPSFQASAGYARNFIREQDEEGKLTHRLWTEVGYDLTANWYDYERTGLSDGGTLGDDNNPRNEIIHSARIFLGWQHVASEYVALRANAEALLNLGDPGDSRFNFEAAASLTVANNLQAGPLVRVLVDTDPTGNAEPVDVIGQLNVTYTML